MFNQTVAYKRRKAKKIALTAALEVEPNRKNFEVETEVYPNGTIEAVVYFKDQGYGKYDTLKKFCNVLKKNPSFEDVDYFLEGCASGKYVG